MVATKVLETSISSACPSARLISIAYDVQVSEASSGAPMCHGKCCDRSRVAVCLSACSGKDDSVPSDFDVLKSTLQQIDLIHEMIDDNPQALGLATSTEDVWRHHRFGRVASLIGVEGLHQIVGSASVLRAYHRLGVQYITLCHDDHNQYADSAASDALFRTSLKILTLRRHQSFQQPMAGYQTTVLG